MGQEQDKCVLMIEGAMPRGPRHRADRLTGSLPLLR